MSKTTSIFSLFLLSLLALAQLAVHSVPEEAPSLEITKETMVWKVMTSLGKLNVNILDKKRRSDKIKGQQLVTQGYTRSFKGNKTASTSKKLFCVACHTIEKEHPNIGNMNPQSRLEYGDSMSIPFLPGAPFYGLVNRVAFFTNDYQQIFAHKNRLDLQFGHRDIRKAIQACNTVYAKGRTLDAWEIESILAYLWTLELKIGDLNIPDSILTIAEEAIKTNRNNARAVNLMRRYYQEVYPASLTPPLPIQERSLISPVLNSFTTGKKVYKQSCLHCHANKRYANFKLDRRQKTFKFLKKHFDSPTRYSIYDAVRYSPGSKGNKTNPPHYTAQRMSNQQLQDLRFYIAQKARLGIEANDYYKNF
jgi:cytochrome c